MPPVLPPQVSLLNSLQAIHQIAFDPNGMIDHGFSSEDREFINCQRFRLIQDIIGDAFNGKLTWNAKELDMKLKSIVS